MIDKKIMFASTALILIYALQFLSARYSLEGRITPAGLTILRFFAAGVMFIPYFANSRRARGLLSLGLARLVILACLAGFPYLMVINTGIKLTSAGYVATVGPGSIVLFSFLLPWILLRAKPDMAAIISTGMICLGIGLFIYNTFLVAELSPVGTALFMLQGLMFSTFGVLNKRWNIDPIQATAAVSLVSCLPAAVFAATVETGFRAASLEELAFQVVAQGALAGVAAIALYTYIVQKTGPQRASLLMPSVPIITTVAGYYLLDESLSQIQVFGLILLALGMATPGLISFRAVAKIIARS